MNQLTNEAEIRDIENQVIARIPGSLSSSSSSSSSSTSSVINVTNISTSDIYIVDITTDVYIERVLHSRIFIGACRGTVYIRSCNDCLITIAAKQVRVRDTNNCILSLFITEPTIIENSTEIVLAPFNGDYHYRNEHWTILGYTQNYNQYMNNYKQVLDMHLESGHQRIPSSIHYTILPSMKELTTLYSNNEDEILHILWNKDINGNISPYVRLLVSILFDTFDMDGDGSWDYKELNKYQEITNDDARLPNQEAMNELMSMHGVPIDTNGHLRYYSLLHLYSIQGGEALERDLDMANVLDAWLYNTESGYPIDWKISNHVLRKAVHIEYKQNTVKNHSSQSTTTFSKSNIGKYSNSPVAVPTDLAFGEKSIRSTKEKETPWSAVFNMGKEVDDEPLLKKLRTTADAAANTARENEGANISNIRPSDRIPTIVGYIFQQLIAKIEETSSSSSSTGANANPFPNLEECLATYDLGRLESQLGGRHAEVGTSDSGVITACDFTYTLLSLIKMFNLDMNASLLSIATTELGEVDGMDLPTSFSGYYQKLKEMEGSSPKIKDSNETDGSETDGSDVEDSELFRTMKYSSALLAVSLGKLSSTDVYVINYGFVLSQAGKIDLSARTQGALNSPAGFPRTNFTLSSLQSSVSPTQCSSNYNINDHNTTGIFAKHNGNNEASSFSSPSSKVAVSIQESIESTVSTTVSTVPVLQVDKPSEQSSSVQPVVNHFVTDEIKEQLIPVESIPSPQETLPVSITAINPTTTSSTEDTESMLNTTNGENAAHEPTISIPTSPVKAVTEDVPSSVPFSPSSTVKQQQQVSLLSTNDSTKIVFSPLATSSPVRTSPNSESSTDRRIRLFKLALASATEGIPKDSKSPTASSWLSESTVDSLLADFDILPEVWALTEAQAEAEKWLASKSGASALHAEEAHVMKESTDGNSMLHGSMNPFVTTQARERVLQRYVGQTLADIAASPSTAQRLFWTYVKDVRNKKWPAELPSMYHSPSEVNNTNGSSDGRSSSIASVSKEEALLALQQLPVSPAAQQYPDGFEAWLRWREANRRASARAYALWKREKDLEAAAAKASGAEVAPIERVERLVHELANSTVQDTRLEVDHLETTSSVPSSSNRQTTRVRRSSRSGLDVEGRMARLRSSATISSSLSGYNEPHDRGSSRRGSVSSMRSNSSVRSAMDAADARRRAPAVVTKAVFEQEFGSALFSLRADPKASHIARALFGARSEARRRVISLLRSDDEAGENMRQRLVQFEQIVCKEMELSNNNNNDRLSPTAGRNSNNDHDSKSHGNGSVSSVITHVSTEDVRAVAFQMLIEDEASQTLNSQGIGENLFTADNHMASLEALAAEEKRRETADEVYNSWKKKKDREHRRRKQAKAEAERETIITQEKRKVEAEKAYEAWVRSTRAQTLVPAQGETETMMSSSSNRRHHHHSSTYSENEEEQYAHGTWRQYASGEREIPRSIRKQRKDTNPLASPLTSPYRTVAKDYGKGITENTVTSSGIQAQHRRPRHITDETSDNVASLMQHPRTPSPRKSKMEPLSMDKNLPERAVSIAKDALDIAQSSEQVGLGTDVSKHALKHSLGVVKEIAHILATKLETISPNLQSDGEREDEQRESSRKGKSQSRNSGSSIFPPDLGIVSPPPKGPVVDKLRAAFGTQLALAQSELKDEERYNKKKQSTTTVTKTKEKFGTKSFSSSIDRKHVTAIPNKSKTNVLNNLIPKEDNSSSDEDNTNEIITVVPVTKQPERIVSSTTVVTKTTTITPAEKHEIVTVPEEKEIISSDNMVAPSLRGIAALDTLREVLGNKLNNARSSEDNHLPVLVNTSIPVVQTVSEDDALPISSSTVSVLREVLGNKLNNARVEDTEPEAVRTKNRSEIVESKTTEEDVTIAASSTAAILRDVLGNKLNAVRSHDEDEQGNISYVSQPEEGDNGDDGDIENSNDGNFDLSPELLRAKRILNEKLYRDGNSEFQEPEDDENDETTYEYHHNYQNHHQYAEQNHHHHRNYAMVDESIQAYPDDIENEVYAEELRLLDEEENHNDGEEEKPVWIPAGKIHRRRSSAIHIRSPVRQGLPPYQEAIYLSQTILPDDFNTHSLSASSSGFNRTRNSSRASSHSRTVGASSRASSTHSPRSSTSISGSPRRNTAAVTNGGSRRSSATFGGPTVSSLSSATTRRTSTNAHHPRSSTTITTTTMDPKRTEQRYSVPADNNETESINRLLDPEDDDNNNNNNNNNEEDGGILTKAHVERLKREAQAAEEQMIVLKQRYGTSNYQGTNKLTPGNVTKGMHVKPPPPPSGSRNGGSGGRKR